MKADDLYIAFAPLQGYTDCVYRKAHFAAGGGVDEYYTPFVRMEGNEPRRKDLRDTEMSVCEGVPTVVQLIARDESEFARLCDRMQSAGWDRIDLNLGCPFPMQVKSGRGCGLILNINGLEKIEREMEHRKDVRFSVKMRLGQNTEEEGVAALEIINSMPLVHLTLHPRLGCQQYKGLPDIEAFKQFSNICQHPIVYNGDILAIEDERLHIAGYEETVDLSSIKHLKGIMLGRGLLAHPWMFTSRDAHEVLRAIHEVFYATATKNLFGESQILSRLHSFWEYVDIERRTKKAILKTNSLRKYDLEVCKCLNVR